MMARWSRVCFRVERSKRAVSSVTATGMDRSGVRTWTALPRAVWTRNGGSAAPPVLTVRV